MKIMRYVSSRIMSPYGFVTGMSGPTVSQLRATDGQRSVDHDASNRGHIAPAVRNAITPSVQRNLPAVLTTSQVLARGWTKGLVRKFLGEPDRRDRNQRYPGGPRLRQYYLTRVEDAEKSAEFVAAKAVADRRSLARRRIAEAKRVELLKSVAALTLTVPIMNEQELLHRAISNCRQNFEMRGISLGHHSGSNLIRCIQVSYLRHEQAEYDSHIATVTGKIGARDAKRAILVKVHTAISKVYPRLKSECDRQLDLELALTREQTGALIRAEMSRNNRYAGTDVSQASVEVGRPSVNEEARQHADQIIRVMAPYACMLTVNFAHPYRHDRFLLDQINRFVVRLNGELFRRQYRRKDNRVHLGGVCVAEVCRDMGPLNNCLHFHFLLKPCSKFDEENVKRVLWPKVQKVLTHFRDVKNRLMTKTAGERRTVHIAPYTGIGSLPKYLSKEYEYYGAEARNLLGILEVDGTGIIGIDSRQR